MSLYNEKSDYDTQLHSIGHKIQLNENDHNAALLKLNKRIDKNKSRKTYFSSYRLSFLLIAMSLVIVGGVYLK